MVNVNFVRQNAPNVTLFLLIAPNAKMVTTLFLTVSRRYARHRSIKLVMVVAKIVILRVRLATVPIHINVQLVPIIIICSMASV